MTPMTPAEASDAAVLAALRAQLRAQQEVIDALVEESERRAESITRLGTQHLVEQRTAHLHHAERVLRSVVEALESALCIVGVDGTVLDANRRWLDRLAPAAQPGPRRPGDLGSDFFAWCRSAPGLGELGAEVATVVREVVADAVDVSTLGPLQDAGRAVKGQWNDGDAGRWVVVRVHPIRDHDQARAVVSLVDITEGMRTQEQLREATEEAQRLALVARATGNGVVITLPDTTIEWVNDPFEHRTGYLLADAVGRRRDTLIDDGCRALPEFATFLERLHHDGSADGEFPMTSRHGERYWAAVQVRPVVEDGLIAHLVWVEQDVTARRDTQQRLRAAMTRAEGLAGALSREKTLLAGVISAVPQMVYWKDGQGRYVGCNAAYLTARGLDDESALLGRTEGDLALDDPIGATLRGLEAQVIASGSPIVDHRSEVPAGRGGTRTLLLSVLPLEQDGDEGRAVIGVGADITHASEMERHLAQANRLESIGQLAAGVAHEIDTPIQYVTDNTRFIADATLSLLRAAEQLAELARRTGLTQVTDVLAPLELDFLGEEIPGALGESREGLSRVAEIVRAMKDYAHPGTGRAEMDVNRAIESTVHVCRNEWKYVARVDLALDPRAGMVPCYEGEFKQVILNMIVNAAQALGEVHTDGGRLGTIRVTSRRTADEMLITIADDGPGMDEKIRDRVFDPFFTTKDVGRGTGQGLTLAHQVIVGKHQGRIDLETAPGQGTTFTLRLPLTVTEPAEQPGR
jgi:two-component system, NtrC family, sensor kinase